MTHAFAIGLIAVVVGAYLALFLWAWFGKDLLPPEDNE
jgi:hypothetical protein